MGLVSKITGVAASQFAKYTGKALKYTKNYSGLPVEHFVKTGTEVFNDGRIKSVALGSGNKLSQYFKQIISYPIGFFGNDKSKMIALLGKNDKPIYIGEPEIIKKFIKDWKELVDVLK